MLSNVKDNAPRWRFSSGKLTGIVFHVHISSKEACFIILVWQITIMSNALFMNWNRWSRSSKFLLKKHTFICNRESHFCLRGNVKVWIWSMSWYLELTTFSGALLFSGEMLLKWLYRRIKSERGFSETKLPLSPLLLVPWESLMKKKWSLYLLVLQKKKFAATKKQY